MHYEGNNVYALGMSGLKPGDIVTIRAYDESNRLIESTKYRIKHPLINGKHLMRF